jgi:spermidine synthase
MAIRWMMHRAGSRYEVRSAGNSIRLYTNQVFHSQFNPTNPVSGNVWDLLMLPVLLFDLQRPLRVLMLGVGGGAVIRQLQLLRGHCEITGLELDPVHLRVARQHFGVRPGDATLIQGDARQWVAAYTGQPFDLVIDDLFGGSEGEPQRAIAATRDWVSLLLALTADDGIIVSNFVDRAELLGSAYCAVDSMQAAFPLRLQLTTPLYENRIGVFSRTPRDSADLRRNLKQIPQLARSLRRGRLRYALRHL